MPKYITYFWKMNIEIALLAYVQGAFVCTNTNISCYCTPFNSLPTG